MKHNHHKHTGKRTQAKEKHISTEYAATMDVFEIFSSTRYVKTIRLARRITDPIMWIRRIERVRVYGNGYDESVHVTRIYPNGKKEKVC